MKPDKQKIYTRITIETQYPDDYGPTISTVEIPVWDATIDDMFTAFERALLAHGFIGSSIASYYRERAEECGQAVEDDDEVISNAPEDQEQVIAPLHGKSGLFYPCEDNDPEDNG